jgi:hypothetical protein
MEMLLTIYEWNHLRCDRIIEPYINVQAVVNDTNVGLRMSSYPAQWTEKAEDLTHSYAFERVLFNEQDVEEKIKIPSSHTIKKRRWNVMNRCPKL